MNYFNKNKFSHGIIFHHFHDNKLHPKSQGSLSKTDLIKLIKFVGRKNILNADEYYDKFKKNLLKKNHVCLTFDDGIKSQFDIAKPILDEYKIKAFFFIFTSNFSQKKGLLELYRYFRNKYFKNIDDFYNLFFEILNKDLNPFYIKKKNKIELWKKQHSYFSLEDIKFRLVRDDYLSDDKYNIIMKKMFLLKNFTPQEHLKNLYMNKKNIIELCKKDHFIGLHSHSHHTDIKKLSFKDQFKEYKKCKSILEKILKNNKKIKTMSHPCGSYNTNTFKVLENLNINLGFAAYGNTKKIFEKRKKKFLFSSSKNRSPPSS